MIGAFPRLTLALGAVTANTVALTTQLQQRTIDLVGVTKAVDGDPSVGRALCAAGCAGLADSRLPALQRLAAAGLGPLTLIRAPQPDEVAAAACCADRALLCDVDTARALGAAVIAILAELPVCGGASHYDAVRKPLEVLLTVDLGDRREGILPEHAAATAATIAELPGIAVSGISVNFACLSGQLPSLTLFREAENVLDLVAPHCQVEPLLSLGGSCCLQHVDGLAPRYRTEVRSGGAPLFGYDFVSGAPLAGLTRTDPVFSAVILESSRKPPAPAGACGFDSLGHVPDAQLPDHDAWYALLACGRRDISPASLTPLLPGITVAGMTSDVTVLVSDQRLTPGGVVSFSIDYDGLVRAVTSPFVTKEYRP